MNTKIIGIDFSKDIEPQLSECAEAIREGKLVVFPTETVYGIGADATDPDAVASIFKAKGRPSDNPLIIHIEKPSDAEKYTYTNDIYYKIAAKYMPGPITVILKARENVPGITRAGLPTVAVRCPENIVARKLIGLSGVAIAAPSANLSGSPSPTTAQHVIDDMSGRVDYIINGGSCDFGLESTIVKIEDDGSLTLLRPGKITVEDLSLDFDKVRVAPAVSRALEENETVLSPGMKYRHYAPTSPVELIDGDILKTVDYIRENGENNIAIISYTENLDALKNEFPNAIIYDFGCSIAFDDQAHRLFAILRDADKKSFDKIYAPLPPVDGVGLALFNRMIRAAAYTIIKL